MSGQVCTLYTQVFLRNWIQWLIFDYKKGKNIFVFSSFQNVEVYTAMVEFDLFNLWLAFYQL